MPYCHTIVLLCFRLQACAAEVGTELQVAPNLAQFSHPDPAQQISVGLAGDHQVLNAFLAVALVRSWEQTHLQHQRQQQENGSGLANTAAAGANGSSTAAAVGTAADRLQQLQSGVLPLAYCEGLKAATWPGRSQVGDTLWTWWQSRCFALHCLADRRHVCLSRLLEGEQNTTLCRFTAAASLRFVFSSGELNEPLTPIQGHASQLLMD